MSPHITSVSQSDAMIQYQEYLARREAARKAERDEQVRREARMKVFDAMINTRQKLDEDSRQNEAGGQNQKAQGEETEEDPGNGLGTYWA